jgi:hypothetical protein
METWLVKTRPARALIGWMSEREAQIMLGIPLDVVKPLPEHVRRVRDAHRAVSSRPIGMRFPMLTPSCMII